MRIAASRIGVLEAGGALRQRVGAAADSLRKPLAAAGAFAAGLGALVAFRQGRRAAGALGTSAFAPSRIARAVLSQTLALLVPGIVRWIGGDVSRPSRRSSETPQCSPDEQIGFWQRARCWFRSERGAAR